MSRCTRYIYGPEKPSVDDAVVKSGSGLLPNIASYTNNVLLGQGDHRHSGEGPRVVQQAHSSADEAAGHTQGNPPAGERVRGNQGANCGSTEHKSWRWERRERHGGHDLERDAAERDTSPGTAHRSRGLSSRTLR